MSSRSASTSKSPFRLFGFISPRTLLYTGAAVLVALFMKKYGDAKPSASGSAPPPAQEEARRFLDGTALSSQEAPKPALLLLDSGGALKETADGIRTAFGDRCTVTCIDIAGRPDVLEYYKAESTPLALLMSPDGAELGRLEAPVTHEKLQVFLQEKLAGISN